MYKFLAFVLFLLSSSVVMAQPDCEYNKTDDVVCMQCNLYHEGRGLDTQELLLIGHTTLERVKSKYYPNSICEVIWQDRQFSWTQDGRSDKVHEKKSWKRVTTVGYWLMMTYSNPNVIVLPNEMTEKDLKGMMWYHAHSVNPKWAATKEIVVKKSGHVYYR